MKGLFYIQLGLFAILLGSCMKEEQPEPEKTVLEFSVDNANSKVAPGVNNGSTISLLWESGDMIDVNGHKSEALSAGGSASASFTFNAALVSPYKATYPASAVTNVGNSTADITLPPAQNSSEGKFDRNACLLIGNGKSKDIRLSHTMAYIAFKFGKGDTDAVLTSLEITANAGEKLSGGFTTDYTEISPKADASSSVTVNCNVTTGSGTAIVVAIPAGEYRNGFNIVAKDRNGKSMSRKDQGTFNAQAGHFYTTNLTYQPDAEGTDYPSQLYIAGDTFEWGWEPKDPRAVISEVENGVYKGEFTFDFGNDGTNGFKFWEDNDWGGEYGMTTDSEFGNIGVDLRSNITGAPADDPQFKLGQLGYQSGEYTVIINLNTKKMTLLSGGLPETLYMSGGFNGWVPVQMEKIGEGKFRITDYEFDFFNDVTDPKGHGIKFFESTENGWPGQWGPKENWENTSYRGWELASYKDAPQFYPQLAGLQSGIYTILVDFTTMKVTLTPKAMEPEPEPEPEIPANLPTVIYLLGDAFDWGWNHPQRVDGTNGVFTITTDLKLDWENADGQGFKIASAFDDGSYNGGIEYGMCAGSTADNIRFDLTSIIGDNQIYLKKLGYKSGRYTITIDFKTMKLTVTASNEPVISRMLSDKNATEQTEKLYANMKRIADAGGTMFGVQMPTTQGINGANSWTAGTNDTNRSDTKDLTGSHPAVCGWEIGHIENGSSNNLDGIPFNKIRSHIIAAYNRGAVNTISWHCNNPVTDGRYNNASDHPISKILPGGSHHEKFRGWVDKAAEFLLSLKASDGTLIPIIFRPWHEHTDRAQYSGFWWSVGNNSNDDYKNLWKWTFDYLTKTKNVHNLIWAYSPDLHHLCWNESGLDKYVYMNAWPGDEYVDILGLDAYETAYSNFDNSVANVVNHALSIAEEKGKPFAITETGLSNNNPGHPKYGYNQRWWTEKLYPLLNGKKVSYALVWRNDGYPTNGGFPEYYNAFPGCYSAEDFLVFAGKNDILLENDLENMYE